MLMPSFQVCVWALAGRCWSCVDLTAKTTTLCSRWRLACSVGTPLGISTPAKHITSLMSFCLPSKRWHSRTPRLFFFKTSYFALSRPLLAVSTTHLPSSHVPPSCSLFFSSLDVPPPPPPSYTNTNVLSFPRPCKPENGPTLSCPVSPSSLAQTVSFDGLLFCQVD